MTNEEKIKSMTREELAELMLMNCYPYCDTTIPDCPKGHNCYKCAFEWLGEKAEGNGPFHSKKIFPKPCGVCGGLSVITRLEGNNPQFAVRCNIPNDPENCYKAYYYSISKTPDDAIRKWNKYQDHILKLSKLAEKFGKESVDEEWEEE